MMNQSLLCLFLSITVCYCFVKKPNDSADIPDCSINDDCDTDRVCAREKCVDPCAGVCGPNTVCHVFNHVAMCACTPGHSGHPTIGCSDTDMSIRTRCTAHDQCSCTKACVEGVCSDPCDGLCGDNTTCTVHLHLPACACKHGYTGNPFIGCSLPVDERGCGGCTTHDQCPSTKACVQGVCTDPCDDFCGDNTICTVRCHVPTCACKHGYSGNPSIGCTIPVPDGTCPPYPRGKKRFYIENSKKADWHEAFMFCLRNHSLLASIESSDEFGVIKELIRHTGRRNGQFWTSGTDHGYEGHYVWATIGTTLSSSLDMWLPGQPDNWGNNEHCVEVWEWDKNVGYGLNDRPCRDKVYFICEYYS